MYYRPERRQGNPGIWATKYEGGWTVYSIVDIFMEGLTTPEMEECLKELTLTVEGKFSEKLEETGQA